jgi:hypothetical protein
MDRSSQHGVTVQDRWYTPRWLVGGRLTVTDRRLAFLPAAYNLWIGAQPLDVALADISGVALQIAAGLSDRRAAALPAVAVKHSGGTTLFAVTRSQELMQALPQRSGS